MDEINLIGLVGFPVEHSKSPEIYNHFFDSEGITSWEYQLFPFPQISEIWNWVISNPNLKGFNVTIPHKQSIIPFLDEVDSKASEIGAVNTVVVQRNKNGIKLIGTNTDFDGFLFSVNSLKSIPKWAYVLGDGGSAKAVKAVLNSLDIPFQIVSRNPCENSISYSEFIEKTILPETLFVQTTPLGMWPDVSSMIPFPSNPLPKNCFAIDLVYNPKETLFLKTLRTLGATCMNGETMLLEQAKRSWKYFKQNEI
jgi:shikimate dehydrogenase